MNIKMIGSGSMFSKNNSACYLVDDKILVDVPNGTTKAILRLGYNITNLECICITHFHADHYFDLPFILLSLVNQREKLGNKELYIVCNKVNESIINKIIECSNFPRISSNIKIIGIDKENNTYNISDKYMVKGISVEHMDGALGYVITDKTNNKRVGFTGDSTLCEGVEKIVNNSDISFCDTTYITGDEKSHMGINDIKYLLSKNLDKKIITTHMKEETREEVEKLNVPNLLMGKDSLEINI